MAGAEAHSGIINSVTVAGKNITALIDRLEVTENIGNERGGGHVVASVRIADGSGIEDSIKGGEEIQFNAGNGQGQNLTFSLVVAEKDSSVQHKPDLKTYDIRCMSKTALGAHSKTADKGYKKQSPTDIIKDVWKEGVQDIEGINLDVKSESEGRIDWATPRGTPINTINALSREGGQSERANNFRLFETLADNNRKYILQTEEDMKKQGAIADFTISFPTDKGPANPGDQSSTVIAHTFDRSFSIPEQVAAGGTSSKTDYTDVATMQFGERSNEFGLDEFNKFGHTGGQSPFGDNTVQLLGNKENNVFEQHIITNRFSNAKSKFYKARRGENEHDRRKQDASSSDQGNRGQTPTMKAAFVVPGNPSLSAGKIINMNVPGTGEDSGFDKTRTGKYLISKLSHIFVKDGNQMKYYTKIEATKDAIG